MRLQSEVLGGGGARRRFLLAQPPDATRMIVLSLHWSGSSPERQARLSAMEGLCASGAAVAFPQGSRPRRSGSEWDLDGDLEYLEELAELLLERFPEAERRVCVCGMSGGARMSSRFASAHPERAGRMDPNDPRSKHVHCFLDMGCAACSAAARQSW
jgi:poly(3-hydroxybutyrate) depolymerase